MRSRFLLPGGPHDAGHSLNHPLPARLFPSELLFAGGREAVELEFAVAVASGFPAGGDPAFSFHTMKRGVERAVLDLQDFFGGLLDVFGDLMAVGGTEKECAQDEHVESTLEEFGAGRGWRLWRHDGRPSTVTIVDALPSEGIVES